MECRIYKLNSTMKDVIGVLILVLMECRIYTVEYSNGTREPRLNPCFNGMSYIQNVVKNEFYAIPVLILVLMECRIYALVGRCWNPCEPVLILVLMECRICGRSSVHCHRK